MATEGQTTVIAREKAADRLAQASAALIKAADKVAAQHGIPENINGLSRGDFLGRVSFVVSMQRELKRAGEDVVAQQILRQQFDAAEPPETMDDLDKLTDATAPAAGASQDDPPPTDVGAMDVTTIPGLNVQMHKALKGAGIHMLEDIEKFTDEALLKVPGIAAPSLAKIRTATAAARAGQADGV